MNAENRPTSAYVLGNHAQELARLDAQAARLEPATRLLLQASGLESGTRVLDLGTGLGHVARLVAQLVGPSGSVIGLDQSEDALREARKRTEHDSPVSFVQGDVTTWRDSQPFDAIVGRLLLFHVADPVAVVRHHVASLRPDGRFVAIDYDAATIRSEPGVPLVREAVSWIIDTFAAAGASPMIGARLGMVLEDAGLSEVMTFGVQDYLPPRSPAGPALLAEAIRSLADAIVGHGIATREQIRIETLEQRMADALVRDNAVLLPPTLAGAWGKRSNT
jgi:SAM-dependent methyltransferase